MAAARGCAAAMNREVSARVLRMRVLALEIGGDWGCWHCDLSWRSIAGI